MGKTLEAHGHQCRVQSISLADPADVSEADLICIGSWVKGLFIIRQHPTEGTMRFIEQLGNLEGKQTVVFCTYKLAVGSNSAANGAGAGRKKGEVVGQFKYRGPEPNSKFALFVKSLK